MRKSAISAIFTVFSSGLSVALLLACSFTTDFDKLDDGNCGAGAKACDDGCASTTDPTFGCANAGCSPCFVSHGTANCSASTQDCAIAACNPNYADCNGTYADGCEAALASDVKNCGRCGNVCSNTVANGSPGCATGRCVVGQCNVGWADCNGVAVDGCETPCGAPAPGTVQTCIPADGGAGWTCQ